MDEKKEKFDPKALAKKEIHTVNDVELGELSFGDLTLGESFEVEKIENLQQRGLQILFIMLQKAYPTLTLEEVKAFPQTTAGRIMELFGKWQSQSKT